MIKKYFDFLNEFNRQDKLFIESISDYFTLSIEYELVADFDIDEEPFKETKAELNIAKKHAKEQALLDMSRGKIGYRFDEKYKLTKAKLQDNEKKMKEENDLTKLSPLKLRQLHLKYLTWTYVNDIIDSVLDLLIDDDEDEYFMDEEYYIKQVNKFQKKFKDEMTNYIINTLDKNIMKFVFEQNMQHLKDMMKEYLPNFTKKWGNTFKYELEADPDKQRILEFSSKSYIKGLNECFEQLNDFYDEFEKQNFWKMNERTALHLNVGVKNKNVRWNPIKGLLLMRDMNRDKKTPFVFTDIMWRITSRFTQSLLDGIRRNLTGEISADYEENPKYAEIKQKAAELDMHPVTYMKELLEDGKISQQEFDDFYSDVVLKYNIGFRSKERLGQHKEYISQNIDKLDLHNIRQVEDFLNSFLIKANTDFYIKEFGIKLVELESSPGYVEFRYVGGNVGRKLFIDKILYFCFVVYLMTNDDYLKEKYHKRLYQYVEDLKGIVRD